MNNLLLGPFGPIKDCFIIGPIKTYSILQVCPLPGHFLVPLGIVLSGPTKRNMDAECPTKDNMKVTLMERSENWHEETFRSKFYLKNLVVTYMHSKCLK